MNSLQDKKYWRRWKVVSECERIFGTKDWEALRTEELLQLSNHLRARPNALRETKRIESEPIDPELVPF